MDRIAKKKKKVDTFVRNVEDILQFELLKCVLQYSYAKKVRIMFKAQT